MSYLCYLPPVVCRKTHVLSMLFTSSTGQHKKLKKYEQHGPNQYAEVFSMRIYLRL
jgi:hypothetical protein